VFKNKIQRTIYGPKRDGGEYFTGMGVYFNGV
jgi:hypothetical protein